MNIYVTTADPFTKITQQNQNGTVPTDCGNGCLWFKDGKLHNDTGPAVEWVGRGGFFGTREWWLNGILQRPDDVNGDTHVIEFEDGSIAWGYPYEGELRNDEALPFVPHLENDPALITGKGVKKWYSNGILHRENGPAITWPCGHTEWHVNGCLMHTPRIWLGGPGNWPALEPKLAHALRNTSGRTSAEKIQKIMDMFFPPTLYPHGYDHSEIRRVCADKSIPIDNKIIHKHITTQGMIELYDAHMGLFGAIERLNDNGDAQLDKLIDQVVNPVCLALEQPRRIWPFKLKTINLSVVEWAIIEDDN